MSSDSSNVGWSHLLPVNGRSLMGIVYCWFLNSVAEFHSLFKQILLPKRKGREHGYLLLRYRIYLNILRYILLINKDPEYVILLKMQLW